MSSFKAPLIPQVLAGPTAIIPPPHRANQAPLSPLTRLLSASLFLPTDSAKHFSLLSLSFCLHPHSPLQTSLSYPLLSFYLLIPPYRLLQAFFHLFLSTSVCIVIPPTDPFKYHFHNIPSPSLCLLISTYRLCQTFLSPFISSSLCLLTSLSRLRQTLLSLLSLSPPLPTTPSSSHLATTGPQQLKSFFPTFSTYLSAVKCSLFCSDKSSNIIYQQGPLSAPYNTWVAAPLLRLCTFYPFYT